MPPANQADLLDRPQAPHKPYAKPTRAELEARIDFTEFLLSRRLRKSQIKREVIRQFQVDARTVERYLARARGRIMARHGKAKEQFFADALAFYESVVSGPDASLREKMQAQGEIRRMLTLDLSHDWRLTKTGSQDGAHQQDKIVAGMIDLAKLSTDDLIILRDIQARMMPLNGGVGTG